jgi:hypothetical protein
MILGLDLSTTCSGITILDASGKIILCDAMMLSKYKDFYAKVSYVQDYLAKVRVEYPEITHIYIEKSLQMFAPGRSSARTIDLLSRFNATITWICYIIFQIKPEHLAAGSARKSAGITIKRGMKAKKIVIAHLIDTEPDFEVEYTIHGNPRPREFDRADSLVIAKAGLVNVNEEKEKNPSGSSR